MRRVLAAFVVALIAATLISHPAEARKKTHHHRVARAGHHRILAPEPDRYSSIVIDANTGYVLSEKDADARRYPASLTKMMTLYLTFEALENGTATKNQRINISSNAEYQEPSKLGLKEGYTIRLEDAIYGVVTRSANDAAMTLAEGIGGSEARFVRMMNAKAQQLGLRNTYFANPTGLHDPAQHSTARDQAMMGQALIRDFPREYRYFSTPAFTFAGLTSINHNKLMQNYSGMDGIKTGYIHQSGYNLVASAVRGGRRLIGVVFGGRTANSRNQAMALLLDSGFERARDPRVLALLQQREKLASARGPQRRPVTIAAAPAPTPPAYNAAAPAAEGEGDVNEADTGKPLPPEAAAFASQFQPMALNNNAIAPAAAPAAAPRVPEAQPPAAPPTQVAMAATPTPQQVQAQVAGTWAIQIGAYSSHDASMSALRNAKEQLPARITTNSRYMIVPLMTNRGMIYRARLAGLDRIQAATACRVLQGSCVVLAVQ